MTLPVKSQRTVTAVDYDPIDKMIYWTEVKPSEFGVIKRATLDGKGQCSIFYFTVILYSCIHAFGKINTKKCLVSRSLLLFATNIIELIALTQVKRFLYN